MRQSLRHWFRNSLILGVPALVAVLTSAIIYNSNKISDTDTLNTENYHREDSLRYSCLTMADYDDVAEELGVSVACIRAVVDIEAGVKNKGFNPDSTPLINFDLTMFRQAARRHNINLDKYKASHPVVFAPLNIKKYGTRQAAQYARLNSAMSIDTVCALESTFWGMFQIGGFNWKLCGCGSVREFVHRVSYSEREQLELFASFLESRNLVGYLRNREWSKFALRYNGPGYARRGYDRRMAAAYAKYSKQEEQCK